MEAIQRCIVIDCTAPVVANGVCRKHYMRIKRHGTVAQTRPDDWGAREKHPLYVLWGGVKRYRQQDLCVEWRMDFWQFVIDVGERPASARKMAHLERLDDTKPLGPSNFYWALPQQDGPQHATYMRQWRKAKLEANADYFRNADYQKRYGVSLEWYNQKLVEQDGKCAICRQPETTKIRGTLIKLAIDHCHETKKVRGLLCKECNGALGQMHHDPSITDSATQYLKRHSVPTTPT